MLSIVSRPPETGGILLGPIGTDEVTKFFFDNGAKRSAASYSPDYVGLSRMMKEEWLPAGIDMKGFAHSHPGHHDWLTAGDLAYIARLLIINDDMTMFVAPLVIPAEFRIRPIVVMRETPGLAQEASLVFF